MLAMLALIPASASAHKASDAYLALRLQGAHLAGQWDIALRDLDFVLQLDGDGDGAIRWGEVLAQRRAIETYALGHLAVQADGRACPLRAEDLLIDQHSDGAYAVLMLEGQCPAPPRRLDLNYTLFADSDPAHRGLVRLETGPPSASTPSSSPIASTLILGGERPHQSISLGREGGQSAPAQSILAQNILAQSRDFVRLGIWHIWTGFDHLLFLFSLLLPSVLRREAGRWVVQNHFRAAAGEVLRIVTAFTLAHSLTLAMAALGVIALPARLTESLIAASVVLAALNNLWPMVTRRVWLVAFGFGLIHGFGFANVLRDLSLAGGGLLLMLFSFNLGVELGQMAVVVAVMPVAWWLRGQPAYQRGVMLAGSAGIAAVAMVWLVERAFDVLIL